jgi:hypothetical protein
MYFVDGKRDDRGGVELVAGGALGALTIAEAAAGLAVCPLCVLATPILIGIGLIRRYGRRARDYLMRL